MPTLWTADRRLRQPPARRRKSGRDRCLRPNVGSDVTSGPIGGSRREVPFCSAATVATAVVLARYSAPDQMRLIADSGAVGGTHSTGCRERSSLRCSRGRRRSSLLPLLRPGTSVTWFCH